MADESTSNTWEWVFKILSALVVPLMIWAVSLEVRLAVLEDDQAEAADVVTEVRQNSKTLFRMEEKFNGVEANIREIKELLRERGGQ